VCGTGGAGYSIRLGHRLCRFFFLVHGCSRFSILSTMSVGKQRPGCFVWFSGWRFGSGNLFSWYPLAALSDCFRSVSRCTSRQRWREKRGIGILDIGEGSSRFNDPCSGYFTTGGFLMIPASPSTTRVVRTTKVVSTLCKNGGAPIFRAIAASLVRNSRFIGAGVRFA
jgi:hypothetical protein